MREDIDLESEEARLRKLIRNHSSTEILRAVRAASRDAADASTVLGRAFEHPSLFWHPHAAASLASFAVQWTNPHRGTPLSVESFIRLYRAVFRYLTLDPIGFDPAAKAAFDDDFDPLLLRISGSQFPYFRPSVFNLSRARLLWRDAVAEARKRPEFQSEPFDDFVASLCGGSVDEYLALGTMLFVGSRGSGNVFTRHYFEQARDELDLVLPDATTLHRMLDVFCADVGEFRQLADNGRLRDRRYRAYDFNPLLLKPIVRPRGTRHLAPGKDELIAPIPSLVARCVSDGIYHNAIAGRAEEFLSAFGFVFEEYVGLLLRAAHREQTILTERDLRRSGYGGKVPDYIVVDETTAVLVECKACRMPVQWLGCDSSEYYYERGLKQVRTAQKQLRAFIEAWNCGDVQHASLDEITTFTPTVITFEPLYLVNRDPFRQKLMRNWSTALPDWTVLSVGELESIQPHVRAGVPLHEAVESFRSVDSPVDALHERTGLTMGDSLLATVAETMWAEVGIDRLRPTS